jgi:acetyl/propionyl-CoA carboxylase alpha subunit
VASAGELEKLMKLEIKIHSGSKTSDHKFEWPAPASAIQGSTGAASAGAEVTVDGETLFADGEKISPGIYSILIDGRSYEALVSKRAGDAEGYSSPFLVTVGLRHYLVEIRDPRRWRRDGAGVREEGPQEIVAPMPGKIVKVLVSENQEVAREQGLLVIEAMKMQNEIRAARAGRVERIYAQEGTGVEVGFRLLRLV